MKKVLEFKPSPTAQINTPLNNLFAAFTEYIDSLVESKVEKILQANLNPQSSEPKKLLKAKELGLIIRYAETTINDMADRGEIPTASYRKVGKKTFRRFDLEQVRAVLEAK